MMCYNCRQHQHSPEPVECRDLAFHVVSTHMETCSQQQSKQARQAAATQALVPVEANQDQVAAD